MSLGKCGCTNLNHVICMGVAASVRCQVLGFFFLEILCNFGEQYAVDFILPGSPLTSSEMDFSVF